MVYILGTLKYPPTSAQDAGKAFFKAMQDFSHLYREGKPAKRVIGLSYADENFEVLTVWEVTGEFLEATIELNKLYLALANDIKGSVVSSKTCLSVMEALPIIGMSPPT